MEKINVTRSSMPPFQEYVDELKDIWRSCWLTNTGTKHQKLEKELAIEKTKNIILTEDEITAFLMHISRKPITDIKQKRALINIFVHSVYLYEYRQYTDYIY